MKPKTLDDLRPCDSLTGPEPHCWSTAFGHRFPWIHTMRLGETPWGWHDGVITDVDGG